MKEDRERDLEQCLTQSKCFANVSLTQDGAEQAALTGSPKISLAESNKVYFLFMLHV